ncbi:hypothetical protein Val02_37700 [Virgisporangium aliadipatigenens]|uniref:WD40 repeat domain-containing protein n=1 Tax=Virgisporangium aliadipatigenens TaxID=741659 RepID=A0A8J4DQR9_9ACTN|nr:hypothetical protein [Virgisporangium aliadipatigenens]GIJ46884.1 hypothetical protein Val02_37700 [Virgisporangium aliadipatigenens]
MTDSLERALRVAVNDLADAGRPVNLAERALRRTRVLRVRRRVATGSLVALTVLTMGGFAVWRPAAPHGPQVAAASPAGSASPSAPLVTYPGPVSYPGRWVLGSFQHATDGNAVVFDRGAGMYRTLPYRWAVLSPAGTVAAVYDAGRLGFLTLGTGTVEWVEGVSAVPSRGMWSPDGTRVVFSGGDKDPSAAQPPPPDLVVVDVATRTARTLPNGTRCGDGCHAYWVSATEVAVDPTDVTTPTTVYAADTGTVTRTLPLFGRVGVRWTGSPDGGYVVLDKDGETIVQDRSARTLVCTLPADTRDVYWIDEITMLVIRPDGVSKVDLEGRVTEVFPFPSWVRTGMVDHTLVKA